MEAGDFGKRIQLRDFLYPGPSGCIPNLQEPAKIRLRGNKELSIASEEKELPWQSTEIFLAKILFFFFFPLPDTL